MSAGMRIVRLDPADAEAFAGWYAAYARAERHGLPRDPGQWQPEELRVMLTEPSTLQRHAAWAGLADGRTVAAGLLTGRLSDNTDRAEVAVHVLPEHRRRGHGTAMLAHLEEQARAWGRRVLGGEVVYDHAVGAAGDGVPGVEFARARGYVLVLGEVLRVLPLPVADGLLGRLAAEVEPYARGYTLRSWVGPVPEELLGGWAALTSRLNTEAPVGDLVLEDETADPAAVREAERQAARQGRTTYATVALAPDGELVAYTDLATTVHDPGRVYQWGTLVRDDHRGHRLGLAVKVANLRLLQREASGLGELITYNAEVNDAMIAVNERLGFRPLLRLAELQRTL